MDRFIAYKLIASANNIAALKSNMDRFIGAKMTLIVALLSLKSNMDRFIVKFKCFIYTEIFSLKSNMDRFIECSLSN